MTSRHCTVAIVSTTAATTSEWRFNCSVKSPRTKITQPFCIISQFLPIGRCWKFLWFFVILKRIFGLSPVNICTLSEKQKNIVQIVFEKSSSKTYPIRRLTCLQTCRTWQNTTCEPRLCDHLSTPCMTSIPGWWSGKSSANDDNRSTLKWRCMQWF